MSFEVQNKADTYVSYKKQNSNQDEKLILPTKKSQEYHLFLMFKNTLQGQENDEQTLENISELISILNGTGIFSIQPIDFSMLNTPNNEECTKQIEQQIKIIQANVYEIIEELEKRAISAKNINYKIKIVTQTNADQELASLIEQQYPNYIEKITVDKLKQLYKNTNNEPTPKLDENKIEQRKSQDAPKQPSNIIVTPPDNSPSPTALTNNQSLSSNANEQNRTNSAIQSSYNQQQKKQVAVKTRKLKLSNYGYTYIKIVPIITIISISIFWVLTFIIIKKLVIK